MKRNQDHTITFSEEEISNMYEFIRNSLDSQWDRYTDNFICTGKWEDGMRRMNPEMYDFAEKLMSIQEGEENV